MLHTAKENYLDRVHSDQKVLKMIRRERLFLVFLVIGVSKLAHGTIRLESTQIRWFS
jgi:hypothetical protein